ncbi:MAG: tRNA (N6-isopentenyl adenosine(37)-C2)-methylthiotransferase MiaB [Lachnospiraceae bacterium]|nr:tRNA (N6-isopentenyl adenosine(37)-C2)-methylthiotransferase MiaB [Lachnospiraceae bacterium]
MSNGIDNVLEIQEECIEKLKEIVQKQSEEKGRPMTASVVTFGCQMNERDSEKLKGILKAAGYELIESEKADVVLYNTCTVRENADTRVFGRLGYLNTIKKKNKEMIIGLCGCMGQEPHIVEKLKESYKFVDLIFGTFNVYKLAELLYARITSGNSIFDVWEESKEFVELLPTERKYSFKSGVNIMYGCDNFCTYCIVPYVRGREKSRPVEDIVDEIKRLTETGVVEVCLLGQNVNSYGKGLDGNVTFASLLREIEKIDGLQRIRFMTPHPKDLSDEVIEVMTNSKKICRHIHLPAQSGSSNILKKMNRNYTREDYLALVDKIKTAMPDISITTDLIVGFPGETEEDFEDTLSLVKEVGYSSAFTFQYSKRTGTPAATFEDQVPEEVMTERFNRLLETVKESSGCNDDLAGKTMDVLVEGKNEKLEGYLSGRLSNNMLVHFKGDEDLIGKIIDVHIDESKGFYYFGTIV